MTTTDIVAKCAAAGIDYDRLKAALNGGDGWGGMVHAFEYLTVLGIVCDAMADVRDAMADEQRKDEAKARHRNGGMCERGHIEFDCTGLTCHECFNRGLT